MNANQPLPKAKPSYVDRLRRQGVRVTPQRLIILEALAAHSGHISADEILQWATARFPAINLATVYRTLDLLIAIGLVAQTNFGSGASFFELVGDAPHHHIICEHCHLVLEVDDDVLLPVHERLLRDYGFSTNTRHIALFGACRECQASLSGDIR